MRDIILVLNTTCNYKCSYCTVQTWKRVMNEETFDKFLDILDEYYYNTFKDMGDRNFPYGRKPYLQFSGGEPLMEPEKMLSVMKRMKKYDDVILNINTNGGVNLDQICVGISQEMLDDRVKFHVSWDGPSQTGLY